MLRETVEIVKSMWSEPDTTYEGKYFQLTGAQCDPKPRAATAPADLDRWWRRAAHAAGRRPSCRPLELRRQARTSSAHKCDVLKEHCTAVGRDYDEIARPGRPRCSSARTSDEIVDGGSRSVLGRAVRLVARRATSWARPSRLPRRSRPTSTSAAPGFVAWCSDYPDTESMRLFAEQVIPEVPLTSRLRLSPRRPAR